MLTGENLGRALREAIELKGVTQKQVADHFGVKPPSVQDWLKRGVIAKDKLPALWAYFADVVGPEHWGLSSYLVAPADDEVRIPQFNTGGKMGNGLVLRDQPGIIRSWAVSPEWLQHNVHRITSASNLVIVTGFGDSMHPVFKSGDPLLVDTGRRRADVDGIYFFRVGEEGYIKRLQRIPTSQGTVLRAKSENPRYDSFDILPGMDFEVFGWVVKAWCGEDF
jgi:hypothetical protein